MSGHTKGPWEIEPCYSNGREQGPWIMQAGGRREIVASVAGAPYLTLERREEIYANAHLIAAAPDLLAYAECEEAHAAYLLSGASGGNQKCINEYFETIKRHGWSGEQGGRDFINDLRRRAIAKARGTTP